MNASVQLVRVLVEQLGKIGLVGGRRNTKFFQRFEHEFIVVRRRFADNANIGAILDHQRQMMLARHPSGANYSSSCNHIGSQELGAEINNAGDCIKPDTIKLLFDPIECLFQEYGAAAPYLARQT